MSTLTRRDLAREAAKHFHGAPEERIAQAVRLGRGAVKLFLATQPPGTTWAEAAEVLRRNTHRGRRPSAVMDAPRR